MKGLTPYEEFQLNKYGNILPDNEGEFEAGSEEAQRSIEWAKMKEEQELLNYEMQFNHD